MSNFLINLFFIISNSYSELITNNFLWSKDDKKAIFIVLEQFLYYPLSISGDSDDAMQSVTILCRSYGLLICQDPFLSIEGKDNPINFGAGMAAEVARWYGIPTNLLMGCSTNLYSLLFSEYTHKAVGVWIQFSFS